MIAVMLLSLAAAVEPVGCRVLLVAKQPGEEIVLADTAPAHCHGQATGKRASAPLVYDAGKRIVLARGFLGVGQNLGLAYFPANPAVRKGDHFAISAHVGHVVIARDVIALQDADHGHRFFVRDQDGQVFVIPSIDAAVHP